MGQGEGGSKVNCEVCGANYAEKHHIIFKSQAKYLENVPINFKYLCSEHHRGNRSPHQNKAIDIKYKREYQDKVISLFTYTGFYKEADIKNILNISNNDVKRIVKKLVLHKEGYCGNELINRLLGNKLY